jgi:hypothetical protein
VLASERAFAGLLEVSPALQLNMNQVGPGWQLKSLPAKNDVLADDVELHASLVKAVEAIRTAFGADSKDVPFLKFRAAVTDKMRPKYVGFLLQRPPDGSPDSGVIKLRAVYEEPPGPVHIRKPLKISVIVRGSRALADKPVLTTLGELESHHIPGLPALSDDKDRRTPIFVGAGEDGIAHPSAWGNSSDHAAAFAIAAFAFASAQKYDLQGSVSTPEAGLPQGAFNDVATDIEKEVTKRFELPGWQVFPADQRGGANQERAGHNDAVDYRRCRASGRSREIPHSRGSG